MLLDPFDPPFPLVAGNLRLRPQQIRMATSSSTPTVPPMMPPHAAGLKFDPADGSFTYRFAIAYSHESKASAVALCAAPPVPSWVGVGAAMAAVARRMIMEKIAKRGVFIILALSLSLSLYMGWLLYSRYCVGWMGVRLFFFFPSFFSWLFD